MTHFSLRFIFLAIILGCLYYFIQLFSFLFIPIIVAFIITIFVRPIVRTLEHWTNLPKWIVIIFVLFSFFISITGLTVVTFYFISKELEAIIQANNWSLTGVTAYIKYICEKIASILPIDLHSLIEDSIPHFFQQLEKNSMDMLKGLFEIMSNVVQSLTNVITFLFIVLFIVFFLLKDESDIRHFFKKITPSTWLMYVKEVQRTLHTSIFRFIKAQFLLVLLTTVIIFICLHIFQFTHVTFITIMTFIIDFIPYIGIGLLFIPMIIFHFLTEQYVATIQLSSLYIFLVLLRQVLEPKWYAASIGLHPLVVFFILICMIHHFGMIGIVFTPVVIILISVLYYTRVFQLIWYYVKTGSFHPK
ncbi:AI-2E family transporter [Pseudogracilibacillus sp. ICA-222130]|uniref:AI-2E family transporter n=1 Tax=Pseudogracilibacillus sp. ICA-222130 TaxID=3134655 RepID=UPI0030C21AE5